MVYVQNYEKWQIIFYNINYGKKLDIINNQNKNECYSIKLEDKNSNEINELIKSFLSFDFSIDNEKNIFKLKSYSFPMNKHKESIMIT